MMKQSSTWMAEVWIGLAFMVKLSALMAIVAYADHLYVYYLAGVLALCVFVEFGWRAFKLSRDKPKSTYEYDDEKYDWFDH